MKSVRHVVLINTISLFAKIIINAFVAILTVRIVLSALGEVDFGIFSLIAGVLIMLSFLNGALLTSTQRFLSMAIGAKDNYSLKLIFNTSFILHLIFSTGVFIIFKILQPVLFNGFLTIPEESLEVAISAYNIIAITMSVTFITAPFNAVINSHEDMWFYALVDILMSFMKLGAALVIAFYTNSSNLLYVYTLLILGATIVCFIIKYVWSRMHYPETKIESELLFNKQQFKIQLGFTGWNTLVSFAVVSRSQGVAVILNVFFGPIINAAYGVANQLNALTTTFATTLSTVFAPQIIQSKGAGDNDRMLRLSIFSSKLSFYLSSIVGIPILLESKTILKLWLKEFPEYAVDFCNISIFIFIVMQMYPGLVRSLYAYGKIKWYQITVSLILITPIPLGYIRFNYFSDSPESIMYLMLIAQILTLFVTIYFSHIYIRLNLKSFLINNVFKLAVIFAIVYFSLFYTKNNFDGEIIRLILVSIISFTFFSILFYTVVLSKNEKKLFNSILKIYHN